MHNLRPASVLYAGCQIKCVTQMYAVTYIFSVTLHLDIASTYKQHKFYYILIEPFLV
jgi:hypothetical protein